jgi:hypothetical protein
MRVGENCGELGQLFDDGWKPELQTLLAAVLAENRRWLPRYTEDVLRVAQRDSEEAKRVSSGLDHAKMIQIAEAAGMRRTLVTIAEQCADLIEQVVMQVPEWRGLRRKPDDEWDALKSKWRVE